MGVVFFFKEHLLKINAEIFAGTDNSEHLSSKLSGVQ